MQKINAEKEIGNNIAKLRSQKGLTQEEMVRELQLTGISLLRGTYAKIEAGIRNVSLHELRGIRKILSASWEDILGE